MILLGMRKKMKNSLILELSVLGLISVLIASCSEVKTLEPQSQSTRGVFLDRPQPLQLRQICQNHGGAFLEKYLQCEYIHPSVCEDTFGGTFNECGSACRNDPNAEICTKQCVPYCQLRPPKNLQSIEAFDE